MNIAFLLMEKGHLYFIMFLLLYLVVFIIWLVYLLFSLNRIAKMGIQAIATVTKCESRYDSNDKTYSYLIYVKYVGNDNKEHFSCYWEDKPLVVGTLVEIKYLPPKYKKIVPVS